MDSNDVVKSRAWRSRVYLNHYIWLPGNEHHLHFIVSQRPTHLTPEQMFQALRVLGVEDVDKYETIFWARQWAKVEVGSPASDRLLRLHSGRTLRTDHGAVRKILGADGFLRYDYRGVQRSSYHVFWQ